MSMDVQGLDGVRSKLMQLSRETNTKVAKAVELSVKDALVVARQLSPVRSGKLRNGNKIKLVSQSETEIVWALYNDVPYAPYVCLGTHKMRSRDFMHPAIAYGRTVLSARLQSIFGTF